MTAKVSMRTSQPMMQIPAPALGVYVSIPFCRAKCSYCNFASGVFGSERMATYVERLAAEIRSIMGSILRAIRDVFSVDDDAKITLECAPGQLSDELLQALPELGVHRVSLGVQSFVDREAAAVGRLHTRESTQQEIDRLRSAGIAEINVDLIAGLPHQTQESWSVSLAEAIATGVPHLSVYMLDVDEDSRLGREILAGGTRYGAGRLPSEQTIAEMYTEACEQFNAAGVAQYEISNFARPGHESRHNLKYWTRQPYVGFGLDAHSFLPTTDGRAIRVGMTDDLATYLEAGQDHSELETITPVSETEALEEAWFLGLRLTEGVSLAAMERQFGEEQVRAFQPILVECEQFGLLERKDCMVRLTQQGRLFANDVFSRFLGISTTEECAAPKQMEEQGVWA